MKQPHFAIESFDSVSAIDARLAELENERRSLLARRDVLQKAKSNIQINSSLSPSEKIAIFRSLFRGRHDIFANRWQNQQGKSSYAVACNNDKKAGKPFCTV